MKPGETLLAYLTRRYEHSSAEQWQQRIAERRVRLDAQEAGAGSPVRDGQRLTWQRPPWVEPEAPCHFEVLHRDDDVLAVSKPAGLPTLPGAGFLESTLLNLVREQTATAAPLHRLGRWTSGVVLFSLNPEARADLVRQWKARAIRKLYRAWASGDPDNDQFAIATPIGPVPHRLLGTVHAACSHGKLAHSQVTVLHRDHDSFLCGVEITTGRPHQIRIHLAAAGHPLVGDRLYPRGGVPDPECTTLPGEGGYLLHAAELTFVHPRSGRSMTVQATGLGPCAPVRS